jgi:hypothetical protein
MLIEKVNLNGVEGLRQSVLLAKLQNDFYHAAHKNETLLAKVTTHVNLIDQPTETINATEKRAVTKYLTL